ncbi:hypothetical protein B0H13DRAFT_2305101 [Mycena leptocephala]|nr:hypothetical protein B0H13DRAFT_2305101 [Mycena leptocephala]
MQLLRFLLLTLHPDAELWLLLSKLTTPLIDSLGVYIRGDLNKSVDHSEELADALLDLNFRSKCTIHRLTLSNVDVDNFLAVDDCPAVFSIISTIRTLRLLRLDIDDIASWLYFFPMSFSPTWTLWRLKFEKTHYGAGRSLRRDGMGTQST